MRRVADALLWLIAVSIPLSTTGMQAGVIALGVLSLAALVARWGVVRATPMDTALGVFYATLALSSLASGHPLEALPGWRELWGVLAYFTVFWWLPDVPAASRFVRNLVGAGALAALYGIVQHFTGIDWFRQLIGEPTRVRPRKAGDPRFAVVGFFRNYLTFAHTMVVPYSGAVGLALRSEGGWGVAAIVLVTAIVFSTARGAWLAVLAVTVAVVSLGRGRRAATLTATLLAVALVAVMQSPALRSEVASMFALGGDNTGRVAIYKANFAIVHDAPVFGLGYGRYRVASRPYYRAAIGADRRSHAHSNFLQLAAEAGLLGLAGFAFVFAHALRLGWDAVRSTAVPARGVAAGAFGALVGFLVGGLTQYTFGDNEVAMAMWCMMAVLMRCRPQDAT